MPYARCEGCGKEFTREEYHQLEWYDHPLCDNGEKFCDEDAALCGQCVVMLTWGDGVGDSLKVVRDRIDFLAKLGGGTVAKSVHLLREIEDQLQAMLNRGSYSSKSRLQG